MGAVPAEGVHPGVRLVGFADPAFSPGPGPCPGPVLAEADVQLDGLGDAAAVVEVQLVRRLLPPGGTCC
ncbi:hypothetical protein [Streptomyces sp. SP18CS02]|uniref:hypothetical protein n=1 Tax=Streptomyces sp. SP18CS02 TaxID=3002531 RepID=UPI002E761140|nr:hypothetical protein [Streptomyces sp. SP18CS02]MEE1753029.1 hypothetical protein [Streptomyces sp. SP18CS02]